MGCGYSSSETNQDANNIITNNHKMLIEDTDDPLMDFLQDPVGQNNMTLLNFKPKFEELVVVGKDSIIKSKLDDLIYTN